MKRAVLVVAVAALCVAGSAVAQDRSGGLIGSGTRTEDSGNVAGQTVGSGGFTTSTQDQWMGNGGRTEEDRQVLGSGMRSGDSGQIVGSGGFTTSTQNQTMGSGARTGDDGQILGSGGLIGSGTRSEDSGQVIDSGSSVIAQAGGYFGSGLSVRELRLPDGSRLVVVSSDEGMLVIPIEE